MLLSLLLIAPETGVFANLSHENSTTVLPNKQCEFDSIPASLSAFLKTYSKNTKHSHSSDKSQIVLKHSPAICLLKKQCLTSMTYLITHNYDMHHCYLQVS